MVAGCLAVELSRALFAPLLLGCLPAPLPPRTFPLTYTPKAIAISDNSAHTEATSAR